MRVNISEESDLEPILLRVADATTRMWNERNKIKVDIKLMGYRAFVSCVNLLTTDRNRKEPKR